MRDECMPTYESSGCSLEPDDIAATMRKWANVLDIPSGRFVNEDCLRAAEEIETLRAIIANVKLALGFDPDQM